MDSDWANLPMHLLDSVSDRLVSLSDYLRFSVVCKSWHSVAKHNQKAHHQFPMLLIFNEKEGTWNVYSVTDNKVLDFQLRLPNKRFCGSSKGWLVTMDENFVVTLLNPFKMVLGMEESEHSIIHLPPLNGPDNDQRRQAWSSRCDDYVWKAMISADPVQNPDDCVVVVTYMEVGKLAFIRLNKDKCWTYSHAIPRAVLDVCHQSENRYYTFDYCGNLFSLDITTPSNITVNCTGMGRLPPLERGYYTSKRYMVMDSNEKELMLVKRFYEHNSFMNQTISVTKEFQLFKFKLDGNLKFIEDERIESLGDVALFVGVNSTVSVVASSFSGVQPNCIYFNDDNNELKHKFQGDFGVYNFGTKSISQVYSINVLSLLKETKQYPVWIVPTFKL